MKMRTCAVAGMFYPREPSHLEQLLEKFFAGVKPEGNPLGIVSPHAGYIYSGQVAATAFGAIPPDFSGTFVVIGPSHRGYINCVSEIPWETPLGVVETDDEFVRSLDIETDELSHRDEHSLEVQMPFIKYRFPRARIAPVMMGQQDYASAMRLAEKIRPRDPTDETGCHGSWRPATFPIMCQKRRQNRTTSGRSNRLSTLDTKEFYRRIAERRVTACGYGPITAMVTACQQARGESGKTDPLCDKR